MTQERIYLTLQKEPGKPAKVVDQHGREVAKVRKVTMLQDVGDVQTMVLHVHEMAPAGNMFTGRQPRTVAEAKDVDTAASA